MAFRKRNVSRKKRKISRKSNPNSFKALKTKYWKKYREHILIRDKFTCQVCKKGPYESKFLDVDHCFSRSHQILHFDERNLTTLCKACHYAKTYCKADGRQKVDDAVIMREGQEVFDKLRLLSRLPHKVTEQEIIEQYEKVKWKYPDQTFGKW